MSNRDSLRNLSKKLPPPTDVKSIIEALREDADRTVAIVGSSLVESSLQILLVSHFKVSDKPLMARLFENRGPLSDFNSKILIAQAFGVMTNPACEELQTIRHIRNVFAHARLPVSFETSEIALEVERFAMLIAMRKVGDPPAAEEISAIRSLPTLSGKSAFLLIVHIMLIMLDGAIVQMGGTRVLGD